MKTSTLASLLLLVACNRQAPPPLPLAPPPKPHVFAAAANPPLNQPWTAVTDFYYDPLNATTTASDNNNCTTSATACLTYKRISYRLGNLYTAQNTTIVIHQHTSNAGLGDAIAANPCFGTGAFVVEADLQQVGSSCTLSAVTARSIDYNTPVQLQATGTCMTAVGQFVINSTHPSRAFVRSNVSGSKWVMTQPLTQCDAATNVCGRTEVNTWAPGDTINVYTMPVCDIAELHTYCGETTGYVGVTHCSFNASFWMTGAFPVMWEDEEIGGDVNMEGHFPEAVNFYQKAGAFNLNSLFTLAGDSEFGGLVPGFEGGLLVQGGVVHGANIGLGAIIGTNAVISGNLGFANNSNSDVYIEVGQPYVDQNSWAYGSVWGDGYLAMLPGTTLSYTNGSASTIFQNGVTQGKSIAFGANRPIVACATNPLDTTNAQTNCHIALTPDKIDLSFGSGGCGGLCWAPGGFGLVGQ